MENPLKYFAEVWDPRVERNRDHLLEEILLIAIAAVLNAPEPWQSILPPAFPAVSVHPEGAAANSGQNS